MNQLYSNIAVHLLKTFKNLFFLLLTLSFLIYWSLDKSKQVYWLEKFCYGPDNSLIARINESNEKQCIAEKLGWYLPEFYISIHFNSINGQTGFLEFHGRNNFFHQYLVRFLSTGDIGLDMEKLSQSNCICNTFKRDEFSLFIGERWKRSFFTGFSGFFLGIIVGILFGLIQVLKTHPVFKNIVDFFLFSLKSIPVFALGIFIIFLTKLGDYEVRSSFWDELKVNRNIKIIGWVVLIYIINIAPVIAQTLRFQINEEINRQYVQTAKAKGLSTFMIVYNHILLNVLPGQIVLWVKILPLVLGGSVIIEHIFDIPGMGLFFWNQINAGEVFTVVILASLYAFITFISYELGILIIKLISPNLQS